MSEYIGPFEALDIACGNAGVHLGSQAMLALAKALVDIGADFSLEVPASADCVRV